ncbi:MAG TPA: NAD-dependent epimerase/dehydratase family protein [Candidatus Polarisedimenticolaceae bacterium]|nr:NAD-dependent epimerase/dehydratase family protein [Candidatus Polarisedimenticolaceae bacterium]
MAQDAIALVTGAGGEMGHLLVPALSERGYAVVAVDLQPLSPTLASRCAETVQASITDAARMEALLAQHRPHVIYHLAALLSRQAEQDPERAHAVNVEATLLLYRLARGQAAAEGKNVRLLFPSSIAVYGLPGIRKKAKAGAVREHEWTLPSGMYGCNKLYCEMVGAYWTARAERAGTPGLDFRSLRFPGLISAQTVPTGGTSDYAPEMVHAAAAGREYACFVREDTRLPFMTMPDAVDAFLSLAEAPKSRLNARVYNVRAFSPTAGELYQALHARFPRFSVRFEPDPVRQALVDTWPGDVEDARARADWAFSPRHGLAEALDQYLLPALQGADR